MKLAEGRVYPTMATRGLLWERHNQAKLDDLRKMWADGVPTRDLARKLDMSPSTLAQVRRRLGMTPRGSPIRRGNT
jgi:hypothetical protein